MGYLLTWNSSLGTLDPAEYEQGIRSTRTGQAWELWWSVGNRMHDLPTGARVFLLHQGDRRGIIAAGALTDGVIRHHGPDWPSMTCVRFETVLPIEDRLPREDLLNKDPNGPWLRAQTSGVELDHRQLQLIESLWAQHLKTLQRDRTV